jgi:chromosome segregation ATPase
MDPVLAAIAAMRQDFELRFDVIERTLESLDKDFDEVIVRLEKLEMRTSPLPLLEEIDKRIRRIESKLNGMAIEFAEFRGDIHNHEKRLETLEEREH